jgi:leucyl aminopeptidase (aminopeptidase T)
MDSELINRLKTEAKSAYTECLRIKDNETVLLIYDQSTEEIAEAFKATGSELGINLTVRKIEPSGVNGKDPDKETCEAMLRHNVIIAPTQYSLTHCAATTKAKKQGVRGATLPGITNGIFERGLKVNPLDLREAGKKWLKEVSGNHEVRITSAAGTDLSFKIGKYPFKNDDGCIFEGGTVGNLPAGEVFVAPDPGTAQGTLVIDGSIGSLEWVPGMESAYLKLENGKIISFDGENGKRLEATLKPHGEKALLVAEFGIGTNPESRMCGNLLEDEKVKGTIHIAFGNNCGFGGDNDVPVHIDGLVVKPDVYIDGKILMKQGEWLLK